MLIGGLQKLTLIDYPGKIACTVFTGGCNFRCGFCHNPELVNPEADTQTLPEKDFLNFLANQKKYLDGVCITGGEPTLQKDLIEFMGKIKKIGLSVKLDTNGSNPEILKKAISGGLVDYIAMDIKGPLEDYERIIGRKTDIEEIKKSISLIQNSGVDYEFRTTLVPGLHNKDSVSKIIDWLAGSKKYYLQQFRKGKTLDNSLNNLQSFTDGEMKEFLNLAKDKFYVCEVRLI